MIIFIFAENITKLLSYEKAIREYSMEKNSRKRVSERSPRKQIHKSFVISLFVLFIGMTF